MSTNALLVQAVAAGELNESRKLSDDGLISSNVFFFFTSWKAILYRNHEQRSPQPVRRTKTQGKPACEDSP